MYEKSKEAFSEQEFQAPGREYRGAPFWSWNGKLEQSRIDEQLRVFQKMGFGGYHIHSRIGLETEYLGKEFMQLVQHCCRYGDELGMDTRLYDEDKWPSGAGGGRVTCDRAYASRYLLFSPKHYPDGFLDRKIVATSRLSKNGDIRLMMRFEVILRDGRLESYRLLKDGEESEHTWYAYCVVTEPLAWFNNQPYLDTLNADATKRFIEVTHERYYEAVGEQFSKTVPSIFTDEPGYHKQESLPSGAAAKDVGIAYTDKMEEFYQARYHESLLERLPEIFWTLADGTVSHVRWQYHDCVAEMFARNYIGTIASWCEAHKLDMTGHVLFEAELESQSQVVGEVMRALSPMTVPGIDMLADRHEYTTAKQAQSVCHQYGRTGVMSELYGVTNWNYDFRGHKHQGDWQAALGVTLRVPHLAWMYMGGESKRDYPSPIDEHTTWYEKYPIIENYFARVNTAMTRGRAVSRIGLVHPIESMWLALGPDDETAQLRRRLDQQFSDVTQWLLFGFLDFDYLSEALLPELYEKADDAQLHVGKMAYDAVVVPGMLTIRSSTLSYLRTFAENGGKVIFMGQIPQYVDGRISDEAQIFAAQCEHIGFDQNSLMDALDAWREVDVIDVNSHLRADRLLGQLRQDGEERWLFVAQGKHDTRLQLNHWYTMTGREDMSVRVRGTYRVRLYDAMNGTVAELPAEYHDGWTWIRHGFYAQDSLLLRLTPTAEAVSQPYAEEARTVLSEQYLPGVVNYRLSEPNVCVLDQAEYRVDGGAWHEKEEILRLDDAIRREYGYPLRTESFPQPWLEPKKPAEHTLELRFRIVSETEGEEVRFGFESKDGAELFWNGEGVRMEGHDWYVDRDIHVETLGRLRKGENEVVLRMPFGPGSNVEACYLLGEFGAAVSGDTARITKKPEMLGFGDMAPQGFPFYGGCVEYCTEVETKAGTVEIEIPEYYAALLHVELDEKQADVFAEPYTARFEKVAAGVHSLRLTAYGTRINTFGQLHNCNRKEEYYGPKSYRTSGKNWSYVYQFHQTGVTVAPIVRVLEEK